jgi:hypothetical protein
LNKYIGTARSEANFLIGEVTKNDVARSRLHVRWYRPTNSSRDKYLRTKQWHMMSYELDLNPIEQRARRNGPIRYRMEEQHKELRYTDVRKHINFHSQILFLDIFSKSLFHI